MKAVEAIRLGLMGIGASGDEDTADKKRLRTLVLAAPLLRRFDSDRPDARELEELQLLFLESRQKFVTARSEEELWRLAAELIGMDARLSRAQSVTHLGDDNSGVPREANRSRSRRDIQ